MITDKEAMNIAINALGRLAADPHRPWALEPFAEGWLIRESLDRRQYRGSSLRVIERATGKIVRFPSSISPGQIMKEWADVRKRGHYEDLTAEKGS